MNLAAAVLQYGGERAAARALGIPRSTFKGRMAKEAAVDVVPLPDDSEPMDVLIKRRVKNFKRTTAAASADAWFPVNVRDDKPIGVLWFGDPHLDDDGCNWDMLMEHVALCASTPGLYGANIGDTTNNWAGRLTRLYGKQEASQSSARKFAKWFLADSGVSWLVWLMGNHDLWDSGADILRSMDIHNRVTMRDWAARFELRFKGCKPIRVHAAHDFPGHSMWNENHGPLRAAKLGGTADLYVCGHRHTWSVGQFETPDGRTPIVARARGYKWHDDYALVGGYHQAKHGAAILTIFDPKATGPGRVLAFADAAQGVRVLQAMRGETAKPRKR